VQVEPDLEAALVECAIVVNAIPTQFIRPVWQRLAGAVPARAVVVSVAKGIEVSSLKRPSEVLREAGSLSQPLVTLSGPTIAAELARRLPATMIAASTDGAAARLVQQTFSGRWLRVYTGDDPDGVELAGAAKNVIALAAGLVDGLGAGCNAKSALLARGLAEIVRLGTALGARAETFFGIAGVGDLATTCFSPEGRNRTCGERLGQGVSLASILSSTQASSGSVIEGVETAKALVALAARHEVDMPIVAAVHAILFDGLRPRRAIESLMGRELKPETIG
jgi:glycerol-3-phosphate dehydrogenase (NAD(P)+)